jgi:hypothetical protein
MTQPDQIKADIETTRAELAETADALAAKLDVKAQAGEKLHAVGDTVSGRYAHARDSAPAPVQKALGSAEQAARPVVAKAGEDKKRTALVAVGALVVLLVVRRLRG